MANIEYVETSRGGKLILHKGYLFRIGVKRNEKHYYKCDTVGCKASLKVIDNILSSDKGTHSHPPNLEKQKRKEFYQIAKERSRTDVQTPVTEIYKETLAEMTDTVEVPSYLPTMNAAIKAMYKVRNKRSSKEKNMSSEPEKTDSKGKQIKNQTRKTPRKLPAKTSSSPDVNVLDEANSKKTLVEISDTNVPSYMPTLKIALQTLHKGRGKRNSEEKNMNCEQKKINSNITQIKTHTKQTSRNLPLNEPSSPAKNVSDKANSTKHLSLWSKDDEETASFLPSYDNIRTSLYNARKDRPNAPETSGDRSKPETRRKAEDKTGSNHKKAKAERRTRKKSSSSEEEDGYLVLKLKLPSLEKVSRAIETLRCFFKKQKNTEHYLLMLVEMEKYVLEKGKKGQTTISDVSSKDKCLSSQKQPEEDLLSKPSMVLGSNLQMTTVVPSDKAAEMDTTAPGSSLGISITPDVDPPDLSTPGPSSQAITNFNTIDQGVQLAGTCDILKATPPLNPSALPASGSSSQVVTSFNTMQQGVQLGMICGIYPASLPLNPPVLPVTGATSPAITSLNNMVQGVQLGMNCGMYPASLTLNSSGFPVSGSSNQVITSFNQMGQGVQLVYPASLAHNPSHLPAPVPSSHLNNMEVDVKPALTCDIYPENSQHTNSQFADVQVKKESPEVSNSAGSLFQPPVLIKEEPVCSEEEL